MNFLIAIPNNEGGITLYPMKKWLRQNPGAIPMELDGDVTHTHSNTIRNALIRRGWIEKITETDIRLVPPEFRDTWEKQDFANGEESENDEDSEISFLLEKQSLESKLRDFIANNLEALQFDGHRYSLFVDPMGRKGVEYSTDVGFIDILTVDESGAFIVFELKRARSPDHTIGQLARYMGWVKSTIGRDKEVRGIIVAKRISENLRFAATVVPNVELYEYEVSFALRPTANP